MTSFQVCGSSVAIAVNFEMNMMAFFFFFSVPDSDTRKSFRVQVSGLDPDGNLAGPENATLILKAELIG